MTRSEAISWLSSVAKALVAGAAAASAYLVGVMGAEDRLSDVSTVQWLALIPVVAAAYGITWRVPNGTKIEDD